MQYKQYIGNEERPYYLFSLSVADISELFQNNFIDINYHDPSKSDTISGYQRNPIVSRYRKFGNFIKSKRGYRETKSRKIKKKK